MCISTDNLSFLDIKYPAERATLVKEYVTAMKTAKQRNMVNREMKLAIGDGLQTLFHPLKKTLTNIDGALTAQRATDARPRPNKSVDTTFGFFKKQDGQLGMGNKVLQLNGNGKNLIADDTKYKLTPGILVLI